VKAVPSRSILKTYFSIGLPYVLTPYKKSLPSTVWQTVLSVSAIDHYDVETEPASMRSHLIVRI